MSSEYLAEHHFELVPQEQATTSDHKPRILVLYG